MAAKTMKAALLHKPGDVRIERVPRPEPGPDDVLVRVKAVGICGSDMHFYRTGRLGSFVMKKPLILGHECAGEVAQVGKHVRTLKKGTPVAVEPGFPCRLCEHCKSGRYNLCSDVRFLAAPPVDGAFCEYLAVPADFAFPLPKGMTFEEGALIEPLAVGMHACTLGNVRPGKSAAVLGAGPIGLVTLQAAKVRGAAPILAVDMDGFRLAKARELGADLAINASRTDPLAELADITEGRGVDIVFETAGAVLATQQTVGAVARGGTIVWVGMLPEDRFSIDVMEFICKEAEIKGVFRYANAYPPSIAMVASGRVHVKSLVTHRFTLDQAPKALAFAASKARNRIKIMIRMP